MIKKQQRLMRDGIGPPPPIDKPVNVGGPPPLAPEPTPYNAAKAAALDPYGSRARPRPRGPPAQSQRGNRIPQYRPQQPQRQQQLQRQQMQVQRQRQPQRPAQPQHGRRGLTSARTNFDSGQMDYLQPAVDVQRSKGEAEYGGQQMERGYPYADGHAQSRRVKPSYPMNMNVEPIVSGHGARSAEGRYPKNQYPSGRMRARPAVPVPVPVPVVDESARYFKVIAELKKKYLPLIDEWAARAKPIASRVVDNPTTQMQRTQQLYKLLRNLQDHLTSDRMHENGLKFIKEKLIPRLEGVQKLNAMRKEKEANRRYQQQQQKSANSQSQVQPRMAQQPVQGRGGYPQQRGPYNYPPRGQYKPQVAPVSVPVPKRKRAEPSETSKRSKPAAQAKRQRKQPKQPKPAEVIVINEDSDTEAAKPKEKPKPKPKAKPKPKPRQRKEPKKRATKRGKKVAQSKAATAAATASTGTTSRNTAAARTASKPAAEKKNTKAKPAALAPKSTSTARGVKPVNTTVAPIAPLSASGPDAVMTASQIGPEAEAKKEKLDQSMQYDSPSSTVSVTGNNGMIEVEEKQAAANPLNLGPLTPSTPFSPPITGTIATDNSFIAYLDDGPKVDWDPVSATCQEIALM